MEDRAKPLPHTALQSMYQEKNYYLICKEKPLTDSKKEIMCFDAHIKKGKSLRCNKGRQLKIAENRQGKNQIK